MDIYLLRHGKAESGAPGMSDRDRELTPEGAASMKEELPGIKNNIPRLDHVLTSPFPRAAQTARIAASAFGLEDKVEEIHALAMTNGNQELLERIEQLPSDCSVMCVGHTPLMGELAEFLSGAQDAYAIKKGGLAKISFPGKPQAGKGSFQWMLKPKDLKQG
jgi:phosphohistidine phosphatase